MGAKDNPNKDAALALNQKVTEGVDKYFSKVKSLTIGGKTYTPTSLKAVLGAEDDASKAVDSTRAQLKQQVATHRTAKASARALRSELRTYILGTQGKAAVQMLADFGMTAPKYGKKTAATKAKAVEQAKATRQARHTVGTQLTVKGVPPTAAEAETPPQGAPASPPAQVAQASQPAQNATSHA